jgi:putative transposase
LVYHVLNRTAGRFRMFRKASDFAAFEHVMIESHQRCPIRLLAWCIMSNHWHFVVWPDEDGQLTDFFRRLAHTHAMRWRVSHNTVGYGHLYQGRFKSFPIERDESVLTVCRYVERNALSAGLVNRAELWPYSSLWVRERDDGPLKALLSPWPVERPDNWIAQVNEPLTDKERERVQLSIARGRPFGGKSWVKRIAGKLDLEHTMRAQGRPRKN